MEKQNRICSESFFLRPDNNCTVFSRDIRDFARVAENIPCQNACPAGTNIPEYIRCIYEKRYGRAYEINRHANIFPGVLGRICSRPCESACRHGESDNGTGVAICHLKRSCSDLKSESHRIIEELYAPTGRKIAIIGAGPAGLAAARDLAVFGHDVTVFEAMEEPGGMLIAGIPEFRLPRHLVRLEINNILRQGIQLKTSTLIGRDIGVEELIDDHDAVIAASGCVKPVRLGIEGEEFEGVYNGLEFMKAFNNGDAVLTGDRVAVIGAGFTAVDCARAAVRLGASDVSINIRRTLEDMRIDENEKYEAGFEGIKINSLVQPFKIIGDQGRVKGVEFVRTRMQAGDDANSRVCVPIEGSGFIVSLDCVIAALGQQPDMTLVPEGKNINGKFFCAGDFLTGSSDVISAVAGGRQCALAVDEFLMGRKRKEIVARLEIHPGTDRPRSYDFIERTGMDTIDIELRRSDPAAEVEKGFNEMQAHEESKRCYLCSLQYEIDPLSCIYCSACIDVAPKECIKMIRAVKSNPDGTCAGYEQAHEWDEVVSIAIDNVACTRCGQCLAACPMDCIRVIKTELIETDIMNDI